MISRQIYDRDQQRKLQTPSGAPLERSFQEIAIGEIDRTLSLGVLLLRRIGYIITYAFSSECTLDVTRRSSCAPDLMSDFTKLAFNANKRSLRHLSEAEFFLSLFDESGIDFLV